MGATDKDIPKVTYEYHRWFAWFPVLLRCPDGLGDPASRYRKRVWLRRIWRYRHEGRTYYAMLPGVDDR